MTRAVNTLSKILGRYGVKFTILKNGVKIPLTAKNNAAITAVGAEDEMNASAVNLDDVIVSMLREVKSQYEAPHVVFNYESPKPFAQIHFLQLPTKNDIHAFGAAHRPLLLAAKLKPAAATELQKVDHVELVAKARPRQVGRYLQYLEEIATGHLDEGVKSAALKLHGKILTHVIAVQPEFLEYPNGFSKGVKFNLHLAQKGDASGELAKDNLRKLTEELMHSTGLLPSSVKELLKVAPHKKPRQFSAELNKQMKRVH